MIHIFECHFIAECDPNELLSEEARRDSGATLMTPGEARAVGFANLPEQKPGEHLRFIAVNARDSQWLHRILERSPTVTRYSVHEAG